MMLNLLLRLLLIAALLLPFGSSKPAADLPRPTETAVQLGIGAENYPRIDGSTSTLPLVQALYTSMFEDKDRTGPAYPHEASKTVPSYRKLIAGDADLIVVPLMSAEIRQEAKAAGVELLSEQVAQEALIFITAKDNPVDRITGDQVRAIYLDNAIRNWSELGGPDKALIPICRNADSGSQSQLDNLILHGRPMHPAIEANHVELTMDGMLEQVAFYHHGGMQGEPVDGYALGYTLYQYLLNMNAMTGIGEELKVLTFDGVRPAADEIAAGYYPLTSGYFAVYRKGTPPDAPVRVLVDFLHSEGGRSLIESAGFMPAK